MAFDYSCRLKVACAFDNVEMNTYTIEVPLVPNAAGDVYYNGYS